MPLAKQHRLVELHVRGVRLPVRVGTQQCGTHQMLVARAVELLTSAARTQHKVIVSLVARCGFPQVTPSFCVSLRCCCLEQIGGCVEWHTPGIHAKTVMSVGPCLRSVWSWCPRVVRFPRCGDVQVNCVSLGCSCANHMCVMFVFKQTLIPTSVL